MKKENSNEVTSLDKSPVLLNSTNPNTLHNQLTVDNAPQEERKDKEIDKLKEEKKKQTK